MKKLLKNIFSNELGLSLMETVVGLGVAGIVGSGIMMGVQRDQDSKQRFKNVNSESKEFDSVMRSLSSKTICDAALIGKGNGENAVILNSISYVVDGRTIDLLKVDNPTSGGGEDDGDEGSSGELRFNDEAGYSTSPGENGNRNYYGDGNESDNKNSMSKNSQKKSNKNKSAELATDSGMKKRAIKEIRLIVVEEKAIFEVDQLAPEGREVTKTFALPVMTESGRVKECYYSEADAYGQDFTDFTLNTCKWLGSFVLADRCYMGDFFFTAGASGYQGSMLCPEGQTVVELQTSSYMYSRTCANVFNGNPCPSRMVSTVMADGTVICRPASDVAGGGVNSTIFENTECNLVANGAQIRIECSCSAELCRPHLYCDGETPELDFCGNSCPRGTKSPSCVAVDSDLYCPNTVIKVANACPSESCPDVTGTKSSGCPNVSPNDLCDGDTFVGLDDCGNACTPVQGNIPLEDPRCSSGPVCDSYPDQQWSDYRDAGCVNGQMRQVRNTYWPDGNCRGNPVNTRGSSRLVDNPSCECPPPLEDEVWSSWSDVACEGNKMKQVRTSSWPDNACRGNPVSGPTEQLVDRAECEACVPDGKCYDASGEIIAANFCPEETRTGMDSCNVSPCSVTGSIMDPVGGPYQCTPPCSTTTMCSSDSDCNGGTCNIPSGASCTGGTYPSGGECVASSSGGVGCGSGTTATSQSSCEANPSCNWNWTGSSPCSSLGSAASCNSESSCTWTPASSTGSCQCGPPSSPPPSSPPPSSPPPSAPACNFPYPAANVQQCTNECEGSSMCEIRSDGTLNPTPPVLCPAESTCYCIEEGQTC